MTEYVLLVALLSPGGDFMSKKAMLVPTKAECQESKAKWEKTKPIMPGYFRGLCVTKAHWEGKVQDKSVALD